LANLANARVFGVVLASGGGSRLGGANKAALMVGGRPMLARARAALAPASRIAVAGGRRVDAGLAGDLERLADPVVDAGPLAGLAAGLAWAEAGGAAWLLSAPVDAPFLAPGVFERLLAATPGDDVDAVLAEAGGRTQWLTAAWRPRLAAAALAALAGDDLSIARFARGCAVETVAISGPPEQFLNVNAPADLEAAAAHAETEAKEA